MAGGQKRKKQNKKLLQFYKVTYNVKGPFDVLLDPSAIILSLKAKLYLRDALPTTMNDRAYPFVTKCVVSALKNEDAGSHVVAKRMQHKKCEHEPAIDARDCLLELLKNGEASSIVSQDPSYHSKIFQKMPKIVVMQIRNNSLFVAKPPSCVHEDHAKIESKKLEMSEFERKRTSKAVEKFDKPKEKFEEEPPVIEDPLFKRKRKAKGPNPLSCKKKKRKIEPSQPKGPTIEEEGKGKRKRKRKRKGSSSSEEINISKLFET